MNEIMVKVVIVAQNILARLRDHSRSGSQGQSLVEYALILALIVLVVIVAMKALQPAISTTFNHVTNCLNSVATPAPTTSPAPCP